MTAITNEAVEQALATLKGAIEALTNAIRAQSQQVRELAEENQRLHDTVKNRDESIAYLRDRNENQKQELDKARAEVVKLVDQEITLKRGLETSRKDCDELLRANVDAGDEIKALRQLILDIATATARAQDIGKRLAAVPTTQGPGTPNPDPASAFGG